LLKIPIWSFFSSQLIEERIPYNINVEVRVHGFVEKYGANDSSRATVIFYGRNLINFVAVKADPGETPVSCAKRLNNFLH
jgi:hypothetical protein